MSNISSHSDAITTINEEAQSRRGFLKKAAFAAIAGGTLAACSDSEAQKAIASAGVAVSPKTALAAAPPSTLSAAAAMAAIRLNLVDIVPSLKKSGCDGCRGARALDAKAACGIEQVDRFRVP